MSKKNAILSDLLFLQRGFDITKKEQKEGPYPVVSSSGVKSYHAAYKVNAPGVVIGRKGTLGTVHYIASDFWPHDTTLWVKDFKGNNPRFCYYFLKTLELERFDSGGANPTLNRNHIHSLEIYKPSNIEQDKIVSVLSNYDDLIDNNNRRIALLEEAVHRLYREWFVHLRFPGHERVAVVDGVPEGWKALDLNSIISIKHGYAFKGQFFSEKPTFRILLTPGNFKIGGGLKLKKIKYYSEEGPVDEDFLLSPNDLLVTMTDLSKASDTIGYPLLTPDLGDLVFLHNQRLGKVIPQEGTPFYRYFLHELFKDFRYRGHVQGSASGTSVKHTSPKKILAYKPVLPPYEQSALLKEFNDFARDSFTQCQTLTRTNRRLAEARDRLLPRLMNGTLPI